MMLDGKGPIDSSPLMQITQGEPTSIIQERIVYR
jgi:hypothetical protein